MLRSARRVAPALLLMFCLAGCGGHSAKEGDEDKGEKAEKPKAEAGAVKLTTQQIATAGIEIVRPKVGADGGSIDVPASIDGDPQRMQVISAAIGGRVVGLTRNLGQSVRQGEVLAVIESREVASLKGDVEAAAARAALAQSNLAREERLFAEKVSPEQDVLAARTAAKEADIALRQARQQLAATGSGGTALNRVGIVSPIGGQVVSRSAVLGQTVAADAELFRVANLSTVSLSLSLSPADAGRVHPGAAVVVTSAGRTGNAKVSFVSPALDGQTKLVPVIATLDNRSGVWRVGEAVQAEIQLADAGGGSIRVPLTAVQTVEGKTAVFVRTESGFKLTPVTLGPQSGDSVIVSSGLTGHEAIAGANSFTLKSELGKGAGGDDD